MKHLRVASFTRVSLATMELDRQRNSHLQISQKEGFEIVAFFEEKLSGATRLNSRPVVLEMIERARNGEFDQILVSELSRLGRTKDVIQIIGELHDAGVGVRILDLSIVTLDENGKSSLAHDIIINVMALAAQAEREALSERTRLGIQNARRFKRIGRPPVKEDLNTFLSKYPRVVKYLQREYSIREIQKLTGKSLGTIQKVKNTIVEKSLIEAVG